MTTRWVNLAINQSYSLQLSPISGSFKQKLDEMDDTIRVLQTESLRYQQMKSERVRRVAELNRLDKKFKCGLPSRDGCAPYNNLTMSSTV